MPILSLNGLEAARVRKANKLATWGRRTEDNRVEPVTTPAFDVPFRLKPGERIFTIGSCFARHVESELVARGFRIPMRELFSTDEFRNLAPEIVNNFGTPSIYNELAWAFGEEHFDEDKAIIEVGKDKYADLHMINSIRPAPLDEVKARRRGLLEATRSLADCGVLIMTLGLAEVWWDEEAQTYINTAPLPAVMKANPERFSIHVLSFQECYDYLKRSLDIAFRHGRDDLRVVITVSPVPMMATHRREDVISANCYSKSVLRAVAEQIVAEDERITYYPSYESVTMTDRRIAWMDDLVHTTRSIVEFNVERMVNAYVGRRKPSRETLPEAQNFPRESVEALLFAEKAKQARLDADEAFFEENADKVEDSPAFALEYGRYLVADYRFEQAVSVLDGLEANDARLPRAQAQLALGDYDAVITGLEPLCAAGVKGIQHWKMLVTATSAKEGKAGVLAVEERWLKATPRNRLQILTHIGNALSALEEYDEAISRLKEVIDADEGISGAAAVLYARAMLATGEPQSALTILEDADANSEWQHKQITVLLDRARKQLEEQNAS